MAFDVATCHHSPVTTTTRLAIPASELRPGDIIVNRAGERIHAAFDVALEDDGAPFVRTWTAETDRERGLPETVNYAPGFYLRVDRRA